MIIAIQRRMNTIIIILIAVQCYFVWHDLQSSAVIGRNEWAGAINGRATWLRNLYYNHYDQFSYVIVSLLTHRKRKEICLGTREKVDMVIGTKRIFWQKFQRWWISMCQFEKQFRKEINMEIANFERMVHFGSGRRKCLSNQLARAFIYSFYVGILQSFKLSTVEGEYPSLKLLPGITQSPEQYKISFKRRWGIGKLLEPNFQDCNLISIKKAHWDDSNVVYKKFE